MKKNIYYLSTFVNINNHAGSKAVNDVDKILSLRNDTKRIKVSFSKYSNLILSSFRLISTLVFVRKKIIIIQETGSNRILFVMLLIKKLLFLNQHTYVGLIHDLINLREGKERKEEKKMLYIYDYLISHNERMTNYLVQAGFYKSKIADIEVFDYLVDFTPKSKLNFRNNNVTIVFAGNLTPSKAGFVYKLNRIVSSEININLYGVNYDFHLAANNLNYKGSFDPDKLPGIIDGHFGLIWDGDELDRCEGNYGNYLKFNNPHKLSLYVASRLPIIIWKQAAMSHFVLANKIGIVVESLLDLEVTIKKISLADYQEMIENIDKTADRLYKGDYTNKAINSILMTVYK